MVSAANYSITVSSGVTQVYGGRSPGGAYFPARVIQDPNYPQALSVNGSYKFPCGPGDPEGFSYLGTKQGDGTRTGGAQQAIIDAMSPGMTLYCILVRQPGDGTSDETPFVSDTYGNPVNTDILAQHHAWFSQLQAKGCYVLLHIFDDHDTADPGFGTGDTSPAAERSFLQQVVNYFEDLFNVIFIIGEEANEGFSNARVSDMASSMRDANNNILIASHQDSGVVFNHKTDSNVRLFCIQDNERSLSQFASDLDGIYSDAVSNGYIYGVTELGSTGPTGDSKRQYCWVGFMKRACMMANYQLRADTMTSAELADDTRLTNFAESTTFYTMAPRDDLIVSSSATHLLANPGSDYIALSRSYSAAIQIASMTAGTYTAHWQACDADQTATVSDISVSTGTNSFTKPGSITSNEVAVWLERQ